MKIFDTESGLYHYIQLPSFAKFIYDNHYVEFIEGQVDLLYEFKVPVLKYFAHLTRKELVDMSIVTTKEWFDYLIANKAKEQITDSLQKWLDDQLEVVGKFQLNAEDITSISHIRSKGLKNLISKYTTDLSVFLTLVSEIDNFIFGSITSATDTYITIIKEQLTKREEQLLEAQSIAKLGSFEWDIVKQKSSNTPSLYQIFEMPEGTGLENFMKHVHPQDKRRVDQAMKKAMVTGNYECEYRYLINGSEKHIWAKGIMHFEDSKPSLLQGTVQDITNRKKVEDDLLQKTLELEKSNESLQQFASVASHDLKEPLRKIAMFSDIVLSKEAEKLSETSQVNLKRVQDSAQRMQEMIEDILSFSSLTKEHDAQTCNLQSLLNEVLEILEFTISEKQAKVISDGLPDAIISPSQFRQVLQNLISNSLKFSRNNVHPIIQISHRFLKPEDVNQPKLKDAKSYLEIIVEDNGIGFEAEYKEQIFGLFSRLHSKSHYEGSGLGLSISRKIIENHGGIIIADPQTGQGARFKIIIPAEL